MPSCSKMRYNTIEHAVRNLLGIYQSPRGDEMQLKSLKGYVVTEKYQSPRGDEMQQGTAQPVARADQDSYQSPRGDEMQRHAYH